MRKEIATTDRWQQVSQIYLAALERDTGDRDAFLREACAGDEDLRREVESLLSYEGGADALLERPAVALAAPMLDTSASPSLLVGRQIGPYKILDTLGEGGMGIVYLAEQERPLRRRVALKVIKVGMDTREVIARFEAERQALALMDHPNIAQVYDAGATDDGRPYFVMEHVPGITITEYCDKHLLSTDHRLELFVQACAAVQHAHQKGIIHRDLKPSNVLVMVRDGRPIAKVIDFGVAKAIHQRLTEKTVFTQLGLLIGTPEYMSPEQAERGGLDVDTTTDIYSLGVLLYELLVGALPFEPGSLRQAGYAEIQRIIRDEEPPCPSTRLSGLGSNATEIAKRRNTDPVSLARELRGDLDWVTLKAMEKDRTRRYPSASELAADISRHLSGETVAARPISTSYRIARFVKRHRLGVGAATLILIMLVAGLAVTAVMYSRAETARDEAEQQAYSAALAAADAGLMAADSLRDASPFPFPTSPSARVAQEAERRLSLVPNNWRGWEWGYLAGKVDASDASLWGLEELRGFNIQAMPGPSELFTRPKYQGRLAVSREGRELLWATRQGVHSWSLDTTRFLKAWSGHGTVTALSDDGSMLLSTDERLSQPWRIIETRTGATLITLDEPEAYAFRTAVFSPDGLYLVTFGHPNVLTVWRSGRKLTATALPSEAEFIRVSGNSQVLVAGVGKALYVWRFATYGSVQLISTDTSTKLIDGDISFDGRFIVTVDVEGTIRWCDTGAGSSGKGHQQHRGARTIAMASDATLAATGARDGAVRLWERSNWSNESAALDPHDGAPINTIRFSSNDSQVFIASTAGVLRVWDVVRARLTAGVSVRGLSRTEAISANGRYAVVTELGSPTVVDLQTLRTQSLLPPLHMDGSGSSSLELARRMMIDAVALAISDAGDTVLWAKRDAAILKWHPGSGSAPEVLASGLGVVTALALAADGRVAAAAFWSPGISGDVKNGSSGQIATWDTLTRRELTKVQVAFRIGSLAFTRDGQELLATPVFNPIEGKCEGAAQVWEKGAKTLQAEFDRCPSVAVMTSRQIVTYSPDDRRIKVWSRRGVLDVASDPIPGVNALAVAENASRLAVGSASGIHIVDLKTLRRLMTIPAATSPFSSVQLRFSPDNSQLVASHSGALRVLYGNPAGDLDVRAMVRSLLTGDSADGVRRDRPWTEDLIHQIVTDRNGDPATQDAIANELRRIGDRDVVALCIDSAQIGARTDATTAEYQRALKHATRAGELAPWSAYCLGVLGIAKYRVADYIGALEAFGRARDIRGEYRPVELAFRAMSLQRVGKAADAAAAAEGFRALVGSEPTQETTTVLAELNATIPVAR